MNGGWTPGVAPLYASSMKEDEWIASVLHALTEPNRLRLVAILSAGEPIRVTSHAS